MTENLNEDHRYRDNIGVRTPESQSVRQRPETPRVVMTAIGQAQSSKPGRRRGDPPLSSNALRLRLCHAPGRTMRLPPSLRAEPGARVRRRARGSLALRLLLLSPSAPSLSLTLTVNLARPDSEPSEPDSEPEPEPVTVV